MCILVAPALFFLRLFRFQIIRWYLKYIYFPLAQTSGFPPPPFFDLHNMTRSCVVLASFSQCTLSCFDRLSHGSPSFPPQRSRSPRPVDWKKGAADVAFSFNSRGTIDLLQCLYYCPRWRSVSSFLQHCCSFIFLLDSCDQRLLVAFPTLLLFYKVSSPASDCPSSSWVQACSETFRRDDSGFVHSLFPYQRRVLAMMLTKPPAGISWSRNLQLILSYHQWCFLLTKEASVIGSRWHRGRFPRHVSTRELRTFLVNWDADNKWMMCWVLPRRLVHFTPFILQQP